MAPHVLCAVSLVRCSAEYHRDLLYRAKRANSTTGAYWDERLCGMTWFSCAGCKNGSGFVEVRK